MTARGLGTPAGPTAFAPEPHGDVTGVITDAGSGDPVGGATVSAGGRTATTDECGAYDLVLEPGTYDLSVAAYGYLGRTIPGVTVEDGRAVSEDVALRLAATRTLSGTVRDASGHGWPVYAAVTVEGRPGPPAYTDPWTGHYSIELPAGSAQQLHVAARYPGYLPVDRQVTLRRHDRHGEFRLTADPYDGSAPGYARQVGGTAQPFDGTGVPSGWSVTDNTDGGGWAFDDPGALGNLTGGDGGFAVMDSERLGPEMEQDTVLTAPAADFTGDPNPVVTFDTYYKGHDNQAGAVEYSTDGGSTWTTAWQQRQREGTTSGPQTVPLPSAAGKADVRVRFHFTGSWGWYWEVDNVQIGNASAQVVPGGLVAGNVTDRNTGHGVNGATVIATGDDSGSATTVATADDPGLADGFYWIFNRDGGVRTYEVTRRRYGTGSLTLQVQSDHVARGDVSLAAGRVSLSAASLERTVPWQGSASDELTVTNTGTAPVTVTIDELPGGAQPLATAAGTGAHRRVGRDGIPTGSAWEPQPDLPVATRDNIAGLDDGVLYSALGRTEDGATSDLYAYDTETGGAWSRKASAADARADAAQGWIGGKWYVTGGQKDGEVPDSRTEVYDPADDTWSTVADMPVPLAGAASAVLEGKLYVVGGCTEWGCESTVQVYDPSADAWGTAADYPERITADACGGIEGRLYCAGGGSLGVSTYAYSPDSDSWTRVADMPVGLSAASYAAAGGLLLVSGGESSSTGAITSEGYAYDPSTDEWTSLPPANTAVCCGAGALGFYKVGGIRPGRRLAATVELLPGFDRPSTADVSWLSESTDTLQLAPGQSAVLRVAFDADVDDITAPGTYTASLTFTTDTPYPVAPVPVTLTVQP